MDDAEQKKQEKAYAKVVMKVWKDPAFKATLMSDPNATLAREGVSMPKGTKVKVVENSVDVFHFVLPYRPTDELSDEALEKVAAGLTLRGISPPMGSW